MHCSTHTIEQADLGYHEHDIPGLAQISLIQYRTAHECTTNSPAWLVADEPGGGNRSDAVVVEVPVADAEELADPLKVAPKSDADWRFKKFDSHFCCSSEKGPALATVESLVEEEPAPSVVMA